MFNQLNPRYQKFFYFSPCSTSRRNKRIPILKPAMIREFLKILLNDENADDDSKLLAGFMFCGGMRVSEVLSIKRSDFFQDLAGDYSVRVKILKRHREDHRTASIADALNDLIGQKLARKRPNEYIFRQRATKEREASEISRHGVLRRMKKLFGPAITNHSFRHSSVALLIHIGY